MFKSIAVALGAAFFIIGVHQTFHYGVIASYWLFALSGICFLLLQFTAKKEEEATKKTNKNSYKRQSKKKKRK